VRIPLEPFWHSWRATADRPVQRLATWLF